jgi:hypothetical protein
MSKRLARVDIGQVYFRHRQWRDRADRVVYGDGSVAVGAGIDDHSGGLFARFLDPGYEIPLVVRLAEIDVQAKRPACRGAILPDLVERLAPVDAGLTFAEHIEIGAVQYKNRFQKKVLSPRGASPSA